MDLELKWSVFVAGARHTAAVAMTLAAVVAIVGTWSRTKSFVPTAVVVLLGAVAVWAVTHPLAITRLVEQEQDDAGVTCPYVDGHRTVHHRTCIGHLEDEEIDQGTDLGG